MKSGDIRKKFLDFFESKGHTIVPSAPMVIKDDPTLMFTNAGMNQFKEFFLGNSKPKYVRVSDTQKCLRVSGKHNDLEEVGMDTYHHTMFEMLGNWSFGDYFKKEAIGWAWELLTEVYRIDKDRLYVTIFEGDHADGLKKDDEAYDFWKQYVDEDRILDGSKHDNFWEMGETGPCGPCSEIHVDIRPDADRKKSPGADLVNKDHPLVVEIWNLVFIQYNRKADGSLKKLPAKHVDTGMGFERLCMVLQGKQSNYETDVFTPLIREIEAITSTRYGKDKNTDIAIRVIADHIRAVAFSIADGQLPSNTGAGYVIRRILRRAIRYGFTFLNKKEPFIYKLTETLVAQMGNAFPELVSEKNLITNVLREEETSFLRTLDQGLVLLENIINTTEGKTVSGFKAFELYDTYGFPIDLTALILRERGLELDEDAFNEELQKQKDRSRAATKVKTGDWTVLSEDQEEEFVGYDLLQTDVKITRYRKVASKKDGEIFQLVFNLTPFYPEGGGQVGDKGYLEASNGEVVYIIDTKKENNLIVHFAKTLPHNPNEKFKAVVDRKQRDRTAANHTATHLLHQALKNILGEHVTQKGSMVHSRNLRFDFSHFSKVTDEELREVEDFVNARIKEDLELDERRNVPYDKAIEEGAIGLFGEKYGDTVRTITFGNSTELCGGTHVPSTGNIWHFIITSESAIAAGIRRIEAITGHAAKQYFVDTSKAFKEVKASLQQAKDPVKAISSLQEQNQQLQKQVDNLLKEKALNIKDELMGDLETVNGVRFMAKELDLDASGLKDLAFSMGKSANDLFLLFGSSVGGKAVLMCYVSKELVESKNINAGQIIKELSALIGGGGGGQPHFATAGGSKTDGIKEAIKQARKYLR